MPGNESSDTTGTASPFFLYDECLAPEIGRVLAHVGFSVEVGEEGKLDETLIPEMGGKHQTWITKDDRSRIQYEDAILAAGISIVFLRGLSHGGRKRSSLARNTISLKQLLLMLVTKLDSIQAEIVSSRKPRFFILFMRGRRRRGGGLSR